MDNLIGHSDAFVDTLEQVSLYASLNRPILVVGERGTGKELIAQRLHYLSERWDQQLLSLNCASLNTNLLESELFGHNAGAFTGASQQRIGRFEQADQGSLFLDELATMPLSLQEKLLRTIEYGQFERVGSNKQIKVDVRLICACNQDLPQLVASGDFRADLLDRLSFAVITLPPLRHRGKDVLLLADHFAQAMSQELSLKQTPKLSTNVQQQLLDFAWPGNIRQLRNVIERAVVDNSNQQQIDEITINPFNSPWRMNVTQSDSSASPALDIPFSAPFQEQVRHFERLRLLHYLKQHDYQQTKAAQAMQLSYHQLRALLKKHNIKNIKQNLLA